MLTVLLLEGLTTSAKPPKWDDDAWWAIPILVLLGILIACLT